VLGYLARRRAQAAAKEGRVNPPDDSDPGGIHPFEELELRITEKSATFRGFRTEEEYIEFLADLGVKM